MSRVAPTRGFSRLRLVKRYLWPIILLLQLFPCSEAVLPFCPSDSTATITSPCRYSPGEHKYLSLTIKSDLYFETNAGASQHTLKVDQTLEITSNAILQVGYNEGTLNQGSGVRHSNGGTGGSFGGRGGTAPKMSLTASQALPYGNPFNVSSLGSAGGGTGHGKGGGFLQLEARKIILNGIVKAPGGRAISSNGGGGSGGGVAVYCFEIDGSGKIESIGGIGHGTGGGGSGGRISVTHRHGAYQWRTHSYGGKTGTSCAFIHDSHFNLHSYL